MKFKKLGNTDLDVSLICLGTMTWGTQNSEKEAARKSMMRLQIEILKAGGSGTPHNAQGHSRAAK